MKEKLLYYLLMYLYIEVIVLLLTIYGCVYHNDWNLFITYVWCQIPMPIIVGIFTTLTYGLFIKENNYECN